MKRKSRLTRRADFDRSIHGGRRFSSTSLALFVRDNEVGRLRVGLAVSRKLGNAVVRNRVKRRLREVVRTLDGGPLTGQDVVIVARPPAANAGYEALRKELSELWMREERL